MNAGVIFNYIKSLQQKSLLVVILCLLPSMRMAADNSIGFWWDNNTKTRWIDYFPDGKYFEGNESHGTDYYQCDLQSEKQLKTITLNPPLHPKQGVSSYEGQEIPRTFSGIHFTLPNGIDGDGGCIVRVEGSTSDVEHSLINDNKPPQQNFNLIIDDNLIDFRQEWINSPLFDVITITIYSPDEIDSEEALRLFLNKATRAHKLTLTSNITLSGGPITIANGQNFTINLNGYTIQRNLTPAVDNGSVFIVENGGTLTINDDIYSNGGEGHGTITGGWTTGMGGGIYNKGTCTINNAYISGNKGNDGGGIYNAATGTLTINNGTINDNKSSQGGGGVVNYGTCTVTGGSIVANSAEMRGGGIWNAGTMEIDGVKITTNSAKLCGGGILNKGILTINSGEISANSSHDGGGIYNDIEGNKAGELKILGGFIQQNEAREKGGGGITNKGTLVVGGGTITENRSQDRGAGIFVGDDSGNNASTITMYGNPVIKDNTSKYSNHKAHNLYLSSGKKIKLSSEFTEGANIYVSCQDGYSVPITDGGTKNYVELNPNARADAYIHYSDDKCGLIIYKKEIARLPYTTSTITYKNQNGGDGTPLKCLDISKLIDDYSASFGVGYNSTSNDTEEWFVLPSSKEFTKRLYTVGDVNLILKDGATLTAKQGIDVPEASSLTVYAQSLTGNQVGKIVATAENITNYAAIGGGYGSNKCGDIRLFGGDITATGNNLGAGIGGDNGSVCSTIEISNATVTATGGNNAAGIGTGAVAVIWKYNNQSQREDADECVYNSNIIIHSGNVTATGGSVGGAGIGGGNSTYFLGNIRIEGGIVHANGNTYYGAGIGAGMSGSCYLFRYPQAEPRERQATITITGGEVYAQAGNYAAAIGGGAQLNENPNLTSPDTYTGIDLPTYQGGGAIVNITGGMVRAITSQSYPGEAIGHGGHLSNSNFSNLPTSGPITIYDEAMVLYPNADAGSDLDYKARSNDRISTLRRWAAMVKPCDHELNYDYEAYSYAIIDDVNHSSCKFCLSSNKKESHSFDPNNYNKCAKCGLVSLPDGEDNTAVLAHYADGGAQSFMLSGRTFTKNGQWHTICLPFANLYDNPLSDYTAMTLVGAQFDKSNGTLSLNFAEADKVDASKPYIIRWNEEKDENNEISNPIFHSVSASFVPDSPGTLAKPVDVSIEVKDKDDNELTVTDENGNKVTAPKIHFRGSYVPKTWAAGTPYPNVLLLGSGNSLFYPDGSGVSKMNSFRAYFELEGLVAGDLGEFPSIRSFKLNFSDEEETGIMDVQTDTSHSAPHVLRPQWFTLDGQRLSKRPTQPGLYIHQGKKVVIK